MSKKEIEITQVIHFAKDDPDCFGDHVDIELIKDGEVIQNYGDYYHDKGQEKVEGFIAGMEYALGATVHLIIKKVADRELY